LGSFEEKGGGAKDIPGSMVRLGWFACRRATEPSYGQESDPSQGKVKEVEGWVEKAEGVPEKIMVKEV